MKKLGSKQILVFGSNLGCSGGNPPTHGRGLAKIARDLYGAQQGNPRGRQGRSYAIVTKKMFDVDRSSTPEEIISEIRQFYMYADIHDELEFIIPYNTNWNNLNGYSHEEMASFFLQAKPIPENVYFHKSYESMMVNEH